MRPYVVYLSTHCAMFMTDVFNVKRTPPITLAKLVYDDQLLYTGAV